MLRALRRIVVAPQFGGCAQCSHVQALGYATRKRFYRQTDILRADGKFEVRLDQRKLKTPAGRPLQLDSEELALAVAAEWDAQSPNIVQPTMHLTSLCNTAIDNPQQLSKHDIANYLLGYLPTDTLLFHSAEDDDLYKMQQEKWEPVLEWFRSRYGVQLERTRGFDAPTVSSETKGVLSRQILSYDFAAVNALMYGVDTLKSLILMLACVERQLTPEAAVLLSRLEEEFQVGHWGRVEWAHELSQQELQARAAAALFLLQCSVRHHSSRDKRAAQQ